VGFLVGFFKWAFKKIPGVFLGVSFFYNNPDASNKLLHPKDSALALPAIETQRNYHVFTF